MSCRTTRTKCSTEVAGKAHPARYTQHTNPSRSTTALTSPLYAGIRRVCRNTPFSAHATSADGTFMALLLRERASYISTLSYMGFREDISWSILRYWIALTIHASSAGPYDMVGMALAAVAELGEPTGQDHLDDPYFGTANNILRSEWPSMLGHVLTEDMLRHIDTTGIYLAPTFSDAKLLVSRIIVGRRKRLAAYRRLQVEGDHL
ncbi:Uu.00g078100.m01.CDS01 [Anthostomella pinea]|uniref:Uu.00g078100.m01.CDS01 n=1 Tax=Anthostomella pinea TaxID=933095 RepID=A0AAI8VKH3_9PEZI|nr:Uu.00g078100.m01.CDS01 [Anthostomella pinea]